MAYDAETNGAQWPRRIIQCIDGNSRRSFCHDCFTVRLRLISMPKREARQHHRLLRRMCRRIKAIGVARPIKTPTHRQQTCWLTTRQDKNGLIGRHNAVSTGKVGGHHARASDDIKDVK